MRLTRPRLVLSLLVLAFFCVLPFVARPVWEWATLITVRDVYLDGSIKRRYVVKRWTHIETYELPIIEKPRQERSAGGLVSYVIERSERRVIRRPHGEFTWWRPNRLLRQQGHYRNGEVVGVWTGWDSAGRVEAQRTYEGGQRSVKFSPPWWNGVEDQVPPTKEEGDGR